MAIDVNRGRRYTLFAMKKDLHPEDYRTVVVQDTSNNTSFLTRSTATTDETIKWEDGNEYPLVKVHISSTSHPFYTGKEKLVDIEGRVDKFKARREVAAKRRDELKKKQANKAVPKKESAKKTKIGSQTPKKQTKPTIQKPKTDDKAQES